MSDRSVCVVTFGCRVNQYETAMMQRLLRATDPGQAHVPDVCVLNACTVTALAERKARQAARRFRREHPEGIVVLIGCLADAVQKGLTRFDDADLLAGNAWKTRIVDVVDRARSGIRGPLASVAPPLLAEEISRGSDERTRAYLKIQDGCAHGCTYCRTVQVRGAPRSKPIASAVEEARRLVESGFAEIVLTGIDLAQYAPARADLADLVRRVLAAPELLRLRIASINVSGLTPRLIEAFAEDDRAAPHFHVPLQSGDDGVLSRMARGYTTADYLAGIAAVREQIPDATFGTDVIVGFPGEDEAAFENTCRIVEDVGFVNLHAFRFSPRRGTAAAGFADPVDEPAKRRRADALTRRWRGRLRTLLDNRIGSTDHVLVEQRRGGTWRGYTSGYLTVHFVSEEEIPVGTIRAVRIVAAAQDHLEGAIDDRTGAR